MPERVCRADPSECSTPQHSGGSDAGGHTFGGAGGTEASGFGGAAASGGVPVDAGSAGVTPMGGTRPHGGASGAGGATAGAAAAGAAGDKSGALELQDSGTHVTTYRYDELRTGTNLSERILDTTRVGPQTFGKTSARPLRGPSYVQPLYVPTLTLPDIGMRNVVYVATAANYVYAFDANDPTREPYWFRQLDPTIPLPDSSGMEVSFVNASAIGILGTPVISTFDGALYVVTATKRGKAYQHRLHKLALETGDELAVTEIAAPGFSSLGQAQRSALLHAHERIYVGFGDYRVDEPSPGWLFAFDAKSLELVAVLPSDETAPQGGIWMGGSGPAASGDSVYVVTDQPSNPHNVTLGSRVLKLDVDAGTFRTSDWFLPYYVEEFGHSELGSSGPLLIPGSQRMVVGGRRYLYVLNLEDLGKLSSNDAAIVQKFRVRRADDCDVNGACARVRGTVFWRGPQGSRLYVWAQGDELRAFKFLEGSQTFDCGEATGVDCDSVSSSAVGGDRSKFYGAQLTLSAHGGKAGTGIVWALEDDVLRAFDATDLSRELWSSELNPARDDPGPCSSMAPPIVSGGQVFVATRSDFTGRVTFEEPRPTDGPAVAGFGEHLVTAWASNALPHELHVAWSRDGRDFSARATTPYFSAFGPALTSQDGAKLFLAWVDLDGHLRVAASPTPDFAQATELRERTEEGSVVPLSARPSAGPALAFGDGRLFVAWSEQETICVMASPDTQSFDPSTKLCLDAGENDGPSLAFIGSRLYLTSRAENATLLESLDHGQSFQPILPLELVADARPALAGIVSSGNREPDVYLFGARWRPNSARNPLEDRWLELVGVPTSLSVAATTWRGSLYVAWSEGIPGKATLARYSPGELVSYGLLPP